MDFMLSPLEVLISHDESLSLLSNSSLTALAAVSKLHRVQSGPAFHPRWKLYLKKNVGFTDSEPEDDASTSNNVSVVRARRRRYS